MVEGSAPLSELTLMKSPNSHLFARHCWIVRCVLSAIHTANAQVNVTQFHNQDSRDGLYIDSAFTPGALRPI